MFDTVPAVVLIIAICMLLLSLPVLFRRKGGFANMHIEHNRHMKAKGINCVVRQDRLARKKRNINIKEKL